MQAQAASPTFTHVYAALVAVLNTKFPKNTELLITRVIINFKKGFKRNNKELCLTTSRFLGHMVNQQVVGGLCYCSMLLPLRLSGYESVVCVV